MRKICVFLSLTLLSVFVHSQNIVVEYNHLITFPAISTNSIYKLELKKDKSVYYQVKSNFTEKEGNDVMQINENVIPFVIKDFSNKTIIYNQPIINSIKFIEDNLPSQTWILKNDTKKIKNFTCKKAITTFRGRKYTAWYTEELSVIGGPWKFDGLPGLILSVRSDDGVLNIEATKIEKKINLELKKFRFNKKKLITWEEYCSKYKKVIRRIRKNFQADSEPDMEYDININLVENIGL